MAGKLKEEKSVKKLIENKRLAFKMATYEWAMASEALRNYTEEHQDMIDCSSLLFMIDVIEEELDL